MTALKILVRDQVTVRAGLGGWRVCMTFNQLTAHPPELPRSATITHPTLFQLEDDAKRFAAKVRYVGAVDTDHWFWVDSDHWFSQPGGGPRLDFLFLDRPPRVELSFQPREYGRQSFSSPDVREGRPQC